MPSEIVRKLTPEEEELLRKREELAAVRASLAERELDLADLRTQLRSFEGRYLREVGALYAELDDWTARIADTEASRLPSAAANQRAEEARYRAERTYDATHGEASRARDFQPPAGLKSLYREIAKRVHPDFAKDDADRMNRTRLMAQANEAYGQGDIEILQRILDDYQESSESVLGEGIGAALVRIIRQIHQAKQNIVEIEKKLSNLRASKIAQLKYDAEVAQRVGRDLLEELAASVRERIARAKEIWQTLAAEAENHDRRT